MNDSVKSDNALPAKDILKKKHEFQEIFSTGKRWDGNLIRCFYRSSDERRVGFAVPKRFGPAVSRNRVRRLMREIYRKRKEQFGSYRIVFLMKTGMNIPELGCLDLDFMKFIDTLASEGKQ
jgi:ribonuclease P protein component